uniref:COP9 signalosome complex subunit 3 n=1 Tax=Arcella intermedia TaxID=1963864 RepID=A0A6B2L4X0_9EUKA
MQKELNKAFETILENGSRVDVALETLDATRHSLGILHLLNAKAVTGVFDNETFIHQVIHFIKNCSIRQIRVDPKKFRNVCLKFTEICRDTHQAIRAIKPLKLAINKIGSSEQMTPQHFMFVQSCIKSKHYSAALPIIHQKIFKIDPQITGLESIDVRLFFYYAGIVEIALKNFAKAIECFELVISAPGIVVSFVMIEAYKKFILVSLCHKGEIPDLPKYTLGSIHSTFKQVAPAYEEFKTSFQTQSLEDLHKVAQNNAEVYMKDGNMGLVKQAIQSLIRQNIQRLTKTYLTLSLQNITDQVSLENTKETEKRVFKMIQNGEVFARINQKDGMVEFLENSENFSNYNVSNYLDKQIHQTIDLTSFVNRIDQEIALDTNYIQKLLRAERTGNARPDGFDEDVKTGGKAGYKS